MARGCKISASVSAQDIMALYKCCIIIIIIIIEIASFVFFGKIQPTATANLSVQYHN